jgi:ABC-type transporter Mla subunit MlaD
MWYSVNEHLHSPHFWTGVGFCLLFIALLTLIFLAINLGFVNMPSNQIYMYGPLGF